MTARALRPVRHIGLGRVLGAGLVLLGVVLAIAVVHDLRRQVSGLRALRADTTVFLRWVAPIGGARAFDKVGMVVHSARTDLVCGAWQAKGGRLCLAIERRLGVPRVVGAVHVPKGGHPRYRRHRLRCPPEATRRTCVLGTPAARPGAIRA